MPNHRPARHATARSRRGFTLIELMVTVVILAILAAVAVPIYSTYVQKGRRSAAIKTLSAISQAQERYRSNTSAYASNLSDLDDGAKKVVADDQYYTYTLSGINTAKGENYSLGYTITATTTPGSTQASDETCAQLTLQMSQGAFGHTSKDAGGNDSTSRCWPH